jgi:uncharacterized protein YbjT (DUF2867 family)
MNSPSPGQARLVIVGATGMVGRYALRHALDHPAEETRHPTPQAEGGFASRLRRLLHTSGRSLGPGRSDLLPWGVYRGGAGCGAPQGHRGLHNRVRAGLSTASPAVAFSFLSGSGADPSGRSQLAFARYKGEAEKALLGAGFSRVYIFRPAYIYPVEPREEPNFGYRLLRGIYPAFRLLFPNQVIRADDLGCVMVDVAVCRTGEPGGLVFENRDIRAMVESLPPSTCDRDAR